MSSSHDLRRLQRASRERRTPNPEPIAAEMVVTMTIGFTTVTHSDTTMTHLLETTMTHVVEDGAVPPTQMPPAPTSTSQPVSERPSYIISTVTATPTEKPQATPTATSALAPPGRIVLGTAATIGLACGIMLALAIIVGALWWCWQKRRKARRTQQAIELQAGNLSQSHYNTASSRQRPQQVPLGYDSLASGQTHPQYQSHHSEGSSSHPEPWGPYNPAMSPPPHTIRASPPIQDPRYPYPQESRYPSPPMDHRRYPSPPQHPPPRPETPRFPPPPEHLPLAPPPLRIPQKPVPPAHFAPTREYSAYRQRGEAPSEIAMRRAALSPIPDPYADSTVYSADTSVVGKGGSSYLGPGASTDQGGSSFRAGESTYTDMRVDEYRRIRGLPPWTESELELGMGRATPEDVSELGPVGAVESEFGDFDGGSAVTSGSSPVSGGEGVRERRSWEDKEEDEAGQRLRRAAGALENVLEQRR